MTTKLASRTYKAMSNLFYIAHGRGMDWPNINEITH